MSGNPPREWFARDSVTMAKELLGCTLLRRDDGVVLSGRIVETEAYGGADDPASHAFRGPRPRNLTMFGLPGHLYVYRSHGIHFCANVVTGSPGEAQAVLLRALEPVSGIEEMRLHRGPVSDRLLCSGPGRLCQAFGIDLEDDGADLVAGDIRIELGTSPQEIAAVKRIGISVATDRPWRMVDASSRFLSRPVPRTPVG